MQAKRRQLKTDASSAEQATPSVPEPTNGRPTPSPWEALSNPLAAYGQLLAARLASEFPVQAVVVRLDQGPFNAPRTACALGSRYAGPVCSEQLACWCQASINGWLQCDRTTPEAPVHQCDLSAQQQSLPYGSDRTFFKQLETPHALLASQSVGDVMLRICLFMSPKSMATMPRQAQALLAALPAITGRLALVLAPPVVKTRARAYTPLSTAEREIFPLLLQRNSERAIAECLNKSRNTIHAHVKSMGLRNPSGLKWVVA